VSALELINCIVLYKISRPAWLLKVTHRETQYVILPHDNSSVMASYPAVYSPTGYGIHAGEVVVRTPQTIKTLQGPQVEAICELLAAMDGTTAASELCTQVPESDPEQIDLLYAADLAYDAQAIPTELQANGWERSLEPILPALSHATQQTLPEQLATCSVAVFGDQPPVSGVCSRLRAAGFRGLFTVARGGPLSDQHSRRVGIGDPA